MQSRDAEWLAGRCPHDLRPAVQQAVKGAHFQSHHRETKKTDLETKKKGRPRVSVCVDGRREMAGAVARLIFDSHLKSSSIIIN